MNKIDIPLLFEQPCFLLFLLKNSIFSWPYLSDVIVPLLHRPSLCHVYKIKATDLWLWYTLHNLTEIAVLPKMAASQRGWNVKR